MKIERIIAAGSLAVGLASIASAAAVPIYVSGSTAYRSQVVSEELKVAAAGLTGGAVPSTADNGTSGVAKDSITAIHGIDANGNEIIFFNHWTGSVAGMVDLAQANTTLTWVTAVPAIGSANTTSVSVATNGSAAEVAMCDCAYTDAATVLASSGGNAAARTASTAISSASPTNGGATAGLEGWVASVDFEWVMGSVASTATAPSITNVTQDQAEALLSGGVLPVAYMTGSNGDGGTAAIYVGRNEDSGTRVLYQSESWAFGTTNKFGLGASTVQYLLNQHTKGSPANVGYSSLSTDATGVDGFVVWPGSWGLNTKPTILWSAAGHSGYNGGGDVAAVLSSPNPITTLSGLSGLTSPVTSSAYTGGVFLTCIGAHDGVTILTNTAANNGTGSDLPNGTLLTYNGVAYSKANIENGTYPLWNFEHLYYLTGSQGNSVSVVANGSIVKADADAVADALYNDTTFGTAPGDVGIPGHIVVGFPAMVNRGVTAGSYIH